MATACIVLELILVIYGMQLFGAPSVGYTAVNLQLLDSCLKSRGLIRHNICIMHHAHAPPVEGDDKPNKIRS